MVQMVVNLLKKRFQRYQQKQGKLKVKRSQNLFNATQDQELGEPLNLSKCGSLLPDLKEGWSELRFLLFFFYIFKIPPSIFYTLYIPIVQRYRYISATLYIPIFQGYREDIQRRGGKAPPPWQVQRYILEYPTHSKLTEKENYTSIELIV